MRTIRKFRDVFPHLSDIVRFYVKLRIELTNGLAIQLIKKIPWQLYGYLVDQRRSQYAFSEGRQTKKNSERNL